MDSINHPGLKTNIYRKLEEEGKDPENRRYVSDSFKYLAEKKSELIKIRLRDYKNDWRKIEKEFFIRTDDFFETTETMDNLTAYLTFTNRCGYNTKKGFFFVTMGSNCPNSIVMHETLHFYTHKLFQPDFEEKGIGSKFNAFKESLTFVMNHIYQDLIPSHHEEGYEIHQEIIKYLESKYKAKMKAKELAELYIRKFKNDIDGK
jgi:uncharacterized protein (UPF0297 family)